MELASQECCLHSVLFTRRYVTFVLVIISLYSVVVLEKNRTRSTIFKSILEQGWGQAQYLYLVLVLKYIFIST